MGTYFKVEQANAQRQKLHCLKVPHATRRYTITYVKPKELCKLICITRLPNQSQISKQLVLCCRSIKHTRELF